MSRYNTKQFNAGQFNRGTDKTNLSSFTDVRSEPFQLELHEANGDFVFSLPKQYGGQWTKEANKPDFLSFSYPVDGTIQDSDFSFGREIWLWEGDNSNPSQKFIIYDKTYVESTSEVITMRCRDLMYQLSMEQVDTYIPSIPSGETGIAISTIVNYLLNNFQVKNNKISLGFLDSEIGAKKWGGNFEIKTLLACLNHLRGVIGGYFYVDIDRKFNWKRSPGVIGQFDLRIGRNCNLIQKTTNDSELANRIIAYGGGLTEDGRVTVTVNDASSQSTYGIRTAFFSDKRINDATVLTDYANAELNRRKVPITTYDIGTIDISRTDVSVLGSFKDIMSIGTKVHLLGGNSGISIVTQIIKIVQSLDNPLKVRIDVENPNAGTSAWGSNPQKATKRNISDTISDITEKLLSNEGDTGTLDEIETRLSENYGDDGESDTLQESVIDAWSEMMEYGSASSPTAHNKYTRGTQALSTVLENDTAVQDSVINAATDAVNDGDASGESDVSNFKNAVTDMLTTSPPSGVTNYILVVYEAADFSSLPTGVESYALGRTTDTGTWYKRNVGNSAWVFLNTWEAGP